jgi:PKD domain
MGEVRKVQLSAILGTSRKRLSRRAASTISGRGRWATERIGGTRRGVTCVRLAARTRYAFAALVCGVVALVATSPASAQPSWLAPARLSGEGQNASEPRVAFDRGGDAVAVWSAKSGANNVVQAAFRPAGGAWQPAVGLSGYGESASEPKVAFDGQGDAVAVWDAYDGFTFEVQAAFKPAGGAWESPVDLSSEEIPGAGEPQVAFDGQGDATAVWHRGGPFGGVVQTAYRPAGGSWQTPVDISASAIGFHPQVTVDERGDTLAAWEQYNGTDYTVWAALKLVGGAWQAPVTVSGAGAENVQVAFDGQGNATAVWRNWADGFLSYHIMQAAFMPAGGSWQAPIDITGAADELDQPKNASEPAMAVDGHGDAVVLWAWEFGPSVIQAAFRPAGSAWQIPVSISKEGSRYPQVAFDGQGNAIAVWDSEDTVLAAFKPVDGAWQAPVNISEEGHGGAPQVAFDGQGDAVTVWDATGAIQGAGYVAAGPSLNGLSIPPTGTVGQPVTFSVSPLDVWSELGETSWSFGDGASASGTSVTHTYTSAGTYEVAVHSADTLGNSTSASGTITVAPEPSPVSASSSSAPVPASEPPTISAASQSVSTWRESGKSPVGTTFSVSLNEQATVSFSFLQGVNGRMVSHRCVGKPAKGIKRGRCVRTAVAGTISFVGHRGKNTVAFQGRVSRSDVLKPGRYQFVAAASNSAGTSKPKYLYFTIAK